MVCAAGNDRGGVDESAEGKSALLKGMKDCALGIFTEEFAPSG